MSKNRKKRTRVAAESNQESDDEAGYFRSGKGDFDEDADEDADEDSDEASDEDTNPYGSYRSFANSI